MAEDAVKSEALPFKSTRYFREQVLRKRPYLEASWIADVLDNPAEKVLQDDGRVRYWGFVEALDDKALRVVTLEDGMTVHNAFPDRNYPPQGPQGDRDET